MMENILLGLVGWYLGREILELITRQFLSLFKIYKTGSMLAIGGYILIVLVLLAVEIKIGMAIIALLRGSV